MRISRQRAPVCLLVEDEAVIGIALEDALRDAGYDVIGPFATCAAALSWLETEKPDVALLDAVLKDGVCAELARKLRRAGVPFVVYSGRARMDGTPEFAGVPWIVKPALEAAVLEAIHVSRA